jgi:malate synthase
MTALFPSREDTELNARALAVLEQDKKNEADCLMDGAWTGHPDQNAIAVAQFPYPNQLLSRPKNPGRYPNLRPTPEGVGKRTANGTREAVRTVIRYRHGVLSGKGASLLDGYMEDLATDRIYRLMIAQRVLHRDFVSIVDDQDQNVKHTPEFITRLFDEELDRLLRELPSGSAHEEVDRFRRARELSEAMIVSGEFNPV